MPKYLVTRVMTYIVRADNEQEAQYAADDSYADTDDITVEQVEE